MTGLLDLDQNVVALVYSMLPERDSKAAFKLSTRFVGHAPSVLAAATTARLDLSSIHSCSNDSNTLLHFKGLHLKQLIVGDIIRLACLGSNDDGDALLRLLQPQGPLSSQVKQRLQHLEVLWMAGIRIKSEDSARAVGNAIKSLPQLHTVRVDGTSMHPAFYEGLAPQPTTATQHAGKKDEALDVPGLRKLHYGFMNTEGPPLKAISAIHSLHSLEFTMPVMAIKRSNVRPLCALDQLRHLAANKDSMTIFEGLEVVFPHLPKLEFLEVSSLTDRQLWELPRSLTRLLFGIQFADALCTQLETLAEMAEPERECARVRHLHISLLCYDGPEDEAGARQLGRRIAGLLHALPHLTLEVGLLSDVCSLPPVLAFLSELPAAKSIKKITGDARLGMPCCEEDQKQEYTIPQLQQLVDLCPDLEKLELAGPRYAKEVKVQDCVGVLVKHLTKLENLELKFKAPVQPDFAEAVLTFCTECALKGPSCNPLVVSIYISGREREIAQLRALKKTWRTRAASLPGKQREIELLLYCDSFDRRDEPGSED